MVNGVSGYNYGYYNKNYNKVNKGLNDGDCETASSIALKNSGVETASSIAFRGGSCETASSIALKNGGVETASSIALKDGGVETTSSIAFKAKPTQVLKNAGTKTKSAVANFPKKIVAFLAGALGIGVAAKASETKTLDSVKFKEVDKLTKYKEKYPELAKALDGYDTYATKYNDVEVPHYSYVGKLAIFETFEKDPQKAYNLAQRLKNDKSKELDPVVLDAIINNYDELKKYPSENSLEESYYKMEIAKQYPLVSDLATLAIKVRSYYPPNVVDAIDLTKYSEFCTDKESAAALLEVVSKDLDRHRGAIRNSAEENIAYAEFYQKHPEMPDVVKDRVFKTKLTPEIETLVEKHLNSSDLNEFANYVKKYGFDGVEELLKYHTMAPKALRVAKSHCGKVEDVKNLTKKIIMTEELFDEIAKKESIEYQTPYPREGVLLKTILDSSRVKLSDAPELAEFIKNMDINKKNLYLRMVEDARSSSIGEMTKLLPVYMKYPDTQITNEMINKFNDPLARAMGLY